jgi:hypothetical protein
VDILLVAEVDPTVVEEAMQVGLVAVALVEILEQLPQPILVVAAAADKTTVVVEQVDRVLS